MGAGAGKNRRVQAAARRRTSRLKEQRPDPAWQHYALHEKVRESLTQLPSHFKSTLNIAGIPTSDLHTFSTPLSAVIENQVVVALNNMREEWDPDGKYKDYSFVRQSQVF